MKKTNIAVRQKAEGEAESYDLYIYDDITKYGDFDWFTWEVSDSTTSANYFKSQLDVIPEDAPINLFINSDGGDVYEATAIYNQLKRHKGKVTAYVDGRAHSAAFTVLQAADHRVMGMGTSAIIHNMWTGLYGNAKELRKAADDLDAMMDSCVQLLMERSNVSEKDLRDMLDAETVLTPEKALEYGFIDEIAERPDKEDTSDDDEPEADPKELEQEIKELRQQLSELKFRQLTANEFISLNKPKEKAKSGFNAFFE